MLHFNLIAIAAGVVSGLLQGALALPAAGGLLLAYIAPLPLFMAGLGLWGCEVPSSPFWWPVV